MSKGTHIILDCYDVPPGVCLNDKLLIEKAIEAASRSGATIINTMRYHFGHDSPSGCCVILMLDESHISIHTYAEEGKMAIDIFTCGCAEADKAVEQIITSLSIKHCIQHKIERFCDDNENENSRSYEGANSARNPT